MSSNACCSFPLLPVFASPPPVSDNKNITKTLNQARPDMGSKPGPCTKSRHWSHYRHACNTCLMQVKPPAINFRKVRGKASPVSCVHTTAGPAAGHAPSRCRSRSARRPPQTLQAPAAKLSGPCLCHPASTPPQRCRSPAGTTPAGGSPGPDPSAAAPRWARPSPSACKLAQVPVRLAAKLMR